MTKLERVLAAIDKRPVDHVPACFSMHFPPDEAFGDAAVAAHFKFLEETGTDILKIMCENMLPRVDAIEGPATWARVPAYDRTAPFIEAQLDLVKRVVDGMPPDVYPMATIHGVCASALHTIEPALGYDAGRRMQVDNLRTDRKLVMDAMARVADTVCLLATESVKAGAKGVFYAALGGESYYYTDQEFAEVIEPLDLMVLRAIKAAGGHVFLHICKDGLNMNRYKNYAPLADVVNWGVHEVPYTFAEGRALFPDSAILGGLANRSGVLVDGTLDELRQAVRDIIDEVGETGFILGADCTLPTGVPIERIMTAVSAAVK